MNLYSVGLTILKAHQYKMGVVFVELLWCNVLQYV